MKQSLDYQAALQSDPLLPQDPQIQMEQQMMWQHGQMGFIRQEFQLENSRIINFARLEYEKLKDEAQVDVTKLKDETKLNKKE